MADLVSESLNCVDQVDHDSLGHGFLGGELLGHLQGLGLLFLFFGVELFFLLLFEGLGYDGLYRTL